MPRQIPSKFRVTQSPRPGSWEKFRKRCVETRASQLMTLPVARFGRNLSPFEGTDFARFTSR